jgi:hypothetical protein
MFFRVCRSAIGPAGWISAGSWTAHSNRMLRPAFPTAGDVARWKRVGRAVLKPSGASLIMVRIAAR